jgi:hypothetical protein
MDRLNNYIQNGKQLTTNKIFLIFSSIGLIAGCIFYILTYFLINSSDIQTVLNDIPTIIIQDGIVQSPQSWNKEVPKLDLVLSIDISSDTPKTTQSNFLFLGRNKYIQSTQGIVQEYILSGYSGEINKNTIISFLKEGMIKTAIFIALFILIFMYLGYYGTYFFSKFILVLLGKKTSTEITKKSSFVGWISVMLLNLILIFFSAGLGWLIAVPTASAISVFCILKGKKEEILN